MINYIKTLIKPPAVTDLVAKELYETKVAYLNAQSNLEYAASMVDYYSTKLSRLQDKAHNAQLN